MIKKRIMIMLTYIIIVIGIIGYHIEVDAAGSLSDQIKEAASGATIKLDKDYTEEVTIPEGANVTLDLNGHRITSDTYKVIGNWGTLKIIDSAGGGIIERKSGDVEGNNNIRCIMNEPNAVLTLEGISLHTNVTDGDPISIGIHNKGLITKISNCNIKAETIGTKWAYGIWNEGTIDDISDGWFYGALLADHQNGNDSFAIYNNKGTVNISGGIFIGITRGSGYGYGICSAGTGTANLSGGSFYAVNGQCYKIINNNTFFEQAVATRDQGTINYKNNTSLTSNTDGARVVLGANQHYITFVDETELPMATYVMDNNGNIVKRMGKVQNRYNVYIKNKTEVVTESDLSRYGSNTILYMNTGDQREAIYFLGSSVTQGTNCWNNSYADYLGDQYGDQVIIRKRALSGTPIADRDPWSYVKRMEKDINPNAKVDHLIVQLSTNDAGWANSPIGKVAAANEFSKSALNANRDTVVGAIEYITAYAQETWGCRVTFWPGPEYNSDKYKEMRSALVNQVYPKWKDHGMEVLDFWTLWKPVEGDINPDGVHPYKPGYLKMVPYTYNYLKDFDAKVVSDCISQIGTVTEEGSCGERIAKARYLYDNMLKDARQNVSNYQTLLDAEKKYASYFEGTRKVDNATEVHVLSGPAGGQYENYTELFDGKITTKSGTGNYTTTPYIWKVNSPIAIKYYKLTTANDSFTWKGRNPREWKLYGSNDYDENGNGTWTEIASVSGDTYLEDENYYEALYKVNNPQRYSYYKWELPKENVGFLQMGEFTMYEDVNALPVIEPNSLMAKIVSADSGATIQLDKDYTEELVIAEGFDVILDLNGHKLTSNTNTVITNRGTLKIIDSAGGGIIEREAGNIGDLTCIMNESTGVLSMDSGTIYTKVTSGDGISFGIYNKGHILKISGGDVKAQTKGSRFAYGIKNEGRIDDISDGWFYGAGLADYQNTNNSLAINNESGTVNISGGIFIGTTRTAGNGYGIRSAGTANLSGGTFYAVNAQAFQVAVATKDNGTINYLNGTSLTENADGARTVVGNGQYFITFVDETETPIATYLMDNNRNIVKRMGHIQDSYNVYFKNKTEVITESDLSRYGSNTILYVDTGDRREVMMFLGSSVTYGSSSYGNSFADYLGDAYGDEVIIRKRAVSGTTLVNEDAGSYVARMKSQINPNAKVDHLIVQLSTNDAGRDYLSMGEVKNDEFSSSQMNDREINGAMEYIIAYAKETWGCKVTFWSGPKNGNARYDEMRNALVNEIQPKWSKYGMGVLDFYTLWKPEAGDIEGDNVHPKKQGYLKMVPIAYQHFKEFDANVVSESINQIGNVTEEGCSGERIAKARFLYDNMLKSARQNVNNYQTLLDAEKKYAEYFEGTREIDNATEVNVLSGPTGGQNENYTELFDGKIATKSGTGNYTTTPYIWKVSNPIAIKYYKLTTANDNFIWKGRNPRDWKLYGSNDYDENGNGTWTEIASVSGDTYLEDENYYDALYKVNNPQRYSYYKWELPNEDVGFLQMAEFTMYEDVNVAPLEPVVTEYTVTYNSDGGSMVANQTVKIGEKVTQPIEPTKEGYIFKGWYLGETEYNFETEVSSDITLTAKWELEESNVGGNEELTDAKENLALAIQKAENKNASDYSEITWNAYQSALNDAKSVQNDTLSTLEEVQNALINLELAESNLITKEEAAREELDKTVKTVESMNYVQNDYTQESWSEYSEALNHAKEALNGETGLTVTQWDALKQALLTAQGALKAADSDKTVMDIEKENLSAVISVVENNNYQENIYTEDSWNEYINALSAAKDALSSDAVTVGEIIETKENLEEAARNLITKESQAKADLDAVIKAVEEKNYKESDYTADSWNAYSNALTAAKNALQSDDITTEQLTELSDALKESERNLSEKDDITPEQPDKDQNSTPEQPDGNQNTTPEQPDGTQNSTPEKPDGTQNSTPEKPDGTQNSTPGQPDGTQNSTPGQSEESQKTETNEFISVEEVDESITSNKTEKDAKDSTYAGLTLSMKQAKKNSIKIKWQKVAGADGYLVYAGECGSLLSLQKDITSGKTTSWQHKGLKKGTYYKYVVVAYKYVNNKKVVVSTSKTIHVLTKADSYTDIKSIKVNKTSVTLKKGKTFRLKANEVKNEKSKKIKRHRKLSYESTNTKIATVSNSGKIKAKSKGKCYVYVYAQNGTYKKIKVIVS